MEQFFTLRPEVLGHAVLDVQIEPEGIEQPQLLDVISCKFGDAVDDDLADLLAVVSEDGDPGDLALGPGDGLPFDLAFPLAFPVLALVDVRDLERRVIERAF